MYDEPLSSYISINTINSQDDSYGSPRENIPSSDSYGSPDPVVEEVYDEYDSYDDELPSYLIPETYEASPSVSVEYASPRDESVVIDLTNNSDYPDYETPVYGQRLGASSRSSYSLLSHLRRQKRRW